MEDFIAALVFFLALTTLTFFSYVATAPFLYSKTIEVPVAAADTAPTRVLYVYNVSKPGGYDIILLEHGDGVVAINGVLVAVFEIYPGGYRCTPLGLARVKIGQDPYTGLWCPPPFHHEDVEGCIPKGVVSRGRWLLVQYICTP